MRGFNAFSGIYSRRRFVLLSALVVVAGFIYAGMLRELSAEIEKPRFHEKTVAKSVTYLLGRDHYTGQEVDDVMSRRCLTLFLKRLDPMKTYFLQSDVAEFRVHQDELDDKISRGNLDFAYVVFNKFLTRLSERLSLVDEFVDAKHDFTKDEYFVTDPDNISYAKDMGEMRERWRKRIKYDLLVFKATQESEEKDKADKKESDSKPREVKDPATLAKEAQDKVWRRYHSFAKRMHMTDREELVEMYLTALTTSYDPHTTYMSVSALENFRISMRLNLEGIGAALRIDDGYGADGTEAPAVGAPREAHFVTIVSKVIEGGAADKMGQLKTGDRIVSVGEGDAGPMRSVVDMKLRDVVDQIRGRSATIVRLGVVPEDSHETKIYSIRRAKIELKESEARSEIITEGTKPDGTPYQIGIINLPSFYMDMVGRQKGDPDFKSTTRDVRRILQDFTAKGVDAVMLDLRYNGGGSLTEAIDLTGLFIKEGTVVRIKKPNGEEESHDDTDPSISWQRPLVVMTSRYSASASEILAGAIQDYHRGIVVGDRTTHGKGTVQSLLDIGRIFSPFGGKARNMGALKITMQKFYRPSGASTQRRGVVADVTLPAITNHRDIGESELDHALPFDKITPGIFTRYNMTDSRIIDGLNAKSKARRDKTDHFQRLARRIESYIERKERKKVSLVESTFMAEWKALEADRDPKLEEDLDADVVVVRNDYFNETLAVTIDYVKALGNVKLAAIN